MKNIILTLLITFILSGCVTRSKTVKPSAPAATAPAVASADILPPAVQTVPMSVMPEEVILPPVRGTARIQYYQITDRINAFIDMKEKSDVPGENSYSGISENELVIFEIKGDKDNIKEASMKLVYPKGIDKPSAELNNAMMTRFLKNSAPEFLEWDMRVRQILDKFDSLKAGSDGIATEDIGFIDRTIYVLYDKNAGYIIVTLRPYP